MANSSERLARVVTVAAVLLFWGCASQSPPPTPVPIDPPPELPIEITLEQAAAMIRAGVDPQAVATSVLGQGTAPALVDPVAGPQFLAAGEPAVEFEGLRFRLRMGLVHPPGPWQSDYVTQVAVRSPFLEWFIGWQNAREFEVPLTPSDTAPGVARVIESDFSIPVRWGCAEVRARLVSAGAPEGVAPQSTAWSNVYVAGVCPSPPPPRVPLAAPEPDARAGVAAGCLGFALFARR